MVSFWPWRGDSSSTASFEKTLSTLSSKITTTQSRLERVRASSRRVRALTTLYLSFAYLVYAIVLLLVVGYRNMGAYEWTGMAGGPVVIYATRTLLSTVYNFRIDSLATRLKEQQQEREKTIQKLKDATKYDSTMELIEKYGGGGKKPQPDGGDADGNTKGGKGRRSRPSDGPGQGTPTRTGMAPPPTANIQRPQLDQSSMPSTPQANSPNHAPSPPPDALTPSAEFAPNADLPLSSPPPPYHQSSSTSFTPSEPRWYDRIFDALLGEDETAPRNRIILLCRSCRLVNGQAPPGTRSLAEVGRWRCMSCGASNGEDEGSRIVREVLAGSAQTPAEEEEHDTAEDGDDDDGEIVEKDEGEAEAEGGDVDAGPAASVRRRRGKGNK